MQDWNDLYFFAQAVSHGSFAAASRALNEPKSKLSRRVAKLEASLGVRLIERSSRRFQLTEPGEAFFESCRNMLNEAEHAEAQIARAKHEPEGNVRMSCPLGVMEQSLAEALPAFMEAFPKIKLNAVVTNRPIDLHEERVDVAIRMRSSPESDGSLSVRTLGSVRRILVASPSLAARLGNLESPKSLEGTATISMNAAMGRDCWNFTSSDGRKVSFDHEPRFVTGDPAGFKAAVVAGLGVAVMLDYACTDEVREGRLVQLLPSWKTDEGYMYLVHKGVRGQSPAVRALVDFLIAHFDGRIKPSLQDNRGREREQLTSSYQRYQ